MIGAIDATIAGSTNDGIGTPPAGPASIAVLTPWFPNRPGDHNSAFVYDSAAALSRAGIAVNVLVCRPWTPRGVEFLVPRWTRGTLEADAFRDLARVEVVRYPSVPLTVFREFRNWVVRRRVVPRLRALARGAQLIHVQTEGLAFFGAEVARALGVPVVVTVHGLDANLQRRPELRPALAEVDRVLLVGDPLRQPFRAFVGRDDHFRIVHNGVELPPRAREGAILDERQPIRFISVSNLHEGKGIDVTLRALAIAGNQGLGRWHYRIVGEGGEKHALMRLRDELGLAGQVEFAGGQPHARIYDFLLGADVFVLPSYREAFGIAYLEAMAAGLLAIGVRGQGPEAFIESGKTGILVEANNPQALAQCLLAIDRERASMRQIAAAGMGRVKADFTWEAHAKRLIGIYRELVS